jgi:hypothetical protein
VKWSLNKLLPTLATLSCFLYLLGRAAWVPISHDEAATYFHYISPGDFVPFIAHWDANNHFLNSALAFFFGKVFGNDLFWLRMPNVLAFLLYAYFGWKIFRALNQPLIRHLGFIALLSAWLPLEFFAQMRGYGLSLGLLMASLYYLICFLKDAKTQQLSLTFLFLILASLANASLNNTYLLVLGIIFLCLLSKSNQRSRHILVFILIGLIPYLFLALYAFELKNRGLLYYGSPENFLEITFGTISRYTFDYSAGPFLIFLVILAVSSSALLLLKRPLHSLDGGKVFAILVLGNAIGSILLNSLFGVNFPEDRTGIYYVPFFIFTLAFALNQMSLRYAFLRYGALAFISFPIVSLFHLNFREVRVWNTLPLSEEIYTTVAKLEASYSRPVIVEGYRLFMLSWGYHNEQQGGKLPPLIPRESSKQIGDFQVCFGDECDTYLKDYKRIWENSPGGVSLLQRFEPVEFSILEFVGDIRYDRYSGLYADLLRLKKGEVMNAMDALEIRALIDAHQHAPKIELVIAGKNNDDEIVYYDFFSIHWKRNTWRDDTLHLIRPVNLPEETAHMVCYLYNVKERPYDAHILEVKVLEVQGEFK